MEITNETSLLIFHIIHNLDIIFIYSCITLLYFVKHARGKMGKILLSGVIY